MVLSLLVASGGLEAGCGGHWPGGAGKQAQQYTRLAAKAPSKPRMWWSVAWKSRSAERL